MKGLVFTEFNEMVINTFDEDMLDHIIDDCSDTLKSGGAYTSVGTYDVNELVELVVALSKRTNVPVPKLVYSFGNYLAVVFSTKFTSFFDKSDDLFSFLKSIHNHIHVEVKKLYPDAELPDFSYDQVTDDCIKLHYTSSRHLSNLAHGLIDGVAQHFKQSIEIKTKDNSTDELLEKVTFTITKC
jgi:hypothetical protein